MSCQGCLPLDCLWDLDDSDLYSIQGDPFAFVTSCPPGFSCNPDPQGGTVSIQCCNDLLSATYPPSVTVEQYSAILSSLVTQCAARQPFCGEDPPPNPPDPPDVLYWNSPQVCSSICPYDGISYSATVLAGEILGATQAIADQAAKNQACSRAVAVMRAHCHPVPLQPRTGDLGMDAALYEPNTNKIFGVRGQWIFQFNPTTGVLEKSGRFCANAAGPTSITAIGTTLYIATSFNPNEDYPTAYLNPGDIFTLDATSFTVTGQFHMATVVGGADKVMGYGPISTNGTLLMFGEISAGAGIDTLLKTPVSVDPTNLAGFVEPPTGGWIGQMEYDSTQGLIWFNDSASPNIYAFAPNGLNWNTDSGLTNTPTGVCWNAAQNAVYACTGTKFLLRANAAAALPLAFNPVIPFFQVDTGITMTPARIRSVNNQAGNAYNGKILIPGWSSDSVVIFDPATNTVSDTKTGFSSPFDVVVTPLMNWAVQTGPVGLKQIP